MQGEKTQHTYLQCITSNISKTNLNTDYSKYVDTYSQTWEEKAH